MEVKRRNYKNNIINEIKLTEILIARSLDTLKNIKESTMDSNFIHNQIKKTKELIELKTIYLEKLKEDEFKVDNGYFDDEIDKEYKDQNIINEKHNAKRLYSKMIEKKEDEEKEIKIKKYLKSIKEDNYKNKRNEKDMDNYLKYFYSVCDTIPPYMKKNIDEMPNNKGYIWRGVHFFGKLPEESGPVVLFEKQKNGVMKIHEWFNSIYRIFERKNNERKVLIHEEYIKEKKIKNNFTVRN